MTTTYAILPGTAVAISRDGGAFEPHVTTRVLSFAEPAEATDVAMTFAKDGWRVRVDRALVVVAESEGGRGEYRQGA